MPFDPDIIVRDEYEKTLLVVETKLHRDDETETGTALKRYMWQMHCLVGMVVKPTSLAIYRDSFVGSDVDSIKLLGNFEIPQIRAGDSEPEFEDAVQDWLEKLGSKTEAGSWGLESWNAVSTNILPALRSGEIRAAHARYRTA